MENGRQKLQRQMKYTNGKWEMNNSTTATTSGGGEDFGELEAL